MESMLQEVLLGAFCSNLTTQYLILPLRQPSRPYNWWCSTLMLQNWTLMLQDLPQAFHHFKLGIDDSRTPSSSIMSMLGLQGNLPDLKDLPPPSMEAGWLPKHFFQSQLLYLSLMSLYATSVIRRKSNSSLGDLCGRSLAGRFLYFASWEYLPCHSIGMKIVILGKSSFLSQMWN